MAQQTINNGDSGLDARTKINDNFTEVYSGVASKQPLDTQLTDLAALSYSGNALKGLRVTASGNGLEFASVANVGTTTIDFGAFPGSSDASVTVTGQTEILAGSIVQAWLRPVDTVDHTADEHMLETIKIVAGNIVAGTGFTIYAFNTNTLNEPSIEPRRSRFSGAGQDAGPGQFKQSIEANKATRIYGQWTVAWSWI